MRGGRGAAGCERERERARGEAGGATVSNVATSERQRGGETGRAGHGQAPLGTQST